MQSGIMWLKPKLEINLSEVLGGGSGKGAGGGGIQDRRAFGAFFKIFYSLVFFSDEKPVLVID